MKATLLHRISRVSGILLALGLQGCLSIMVEERAGPLVQQLETLETFPIDAPRVQITPHNDGLGWLVTAEQQVEHHVREQTSQDWKGRRYVFSPFSLLAGLVQCPIGIFHLFTTNSSNNMFRFGCSRLFMLEPLDGTVPLPPTISSKVLTQTAWEPLRHGVVQVAWREPRSRIVTYALSEQGQADIRLSHALSLLVAANQPLSLRQNLTLLLHIRHAEEVSPEQALSVTARQLEPIKRLIPTSLLSEQWPAPLVLRIKVDGTTMTEEEGELIRDRLTAWALHRQICAVASDRFHPSLSDEHQVQYSGGLAEQQQIQLGRLLPASVVLTASKSESSQGRDSIRHLAIRIGTVREGQILATAHGSSRSPSILHPLEQAVTELNVILANAPQTGCPLNHISSLENH
jgi:DNA polymerase III psi subunit